MPSISHPSHYLSETRYYSAPRPVSQLPAAFFLSHLHCKCDLYLEGWLHVSQSVWENVGVLKSVHMYLCVCVCVFKKETKGVRAQWNPEGRVKRISVCLCAQKCSDIWFKSRHTLLLCFCHYINIRANRKCIYREALYACVWVRVTGLGQSANPLRHPSAPPRHPLAPTLPPHVTGCREC